MIENMNELNELENYNCVYNPETPTAPSKGDCLPTTTSHYRSGNCTYIMPSFNNNEPYYAFHEIVLTLDDMPLHSNVPENKLYLAANTERKANILLTELTSIEGLKEQEVGIYFYKEGTPEPILEIWDQPDDENDVFIDFSKHIGKFTPGNYFLLVANAEYQQGSTRIDMMGGYSRFSFSLLQSGKELAHPEVVSGNIQRKTPAKGLSEMIAGCLNFNLTLDRKTEQQHEYKITCYHESLHVMGNGNCYIQNDMNASRFLNIPVHSERLWMKGNYFAILSHNDEPFCRIDFTWEGGTCTISRCRKITPNSIEYLLLKSSTDDKTEWEPIREIPGVTDLKWLLLERNNHKLLERIRRNYQLACWENNTNFMLIGPDNDNRKKLAEHIPFLLDRYTRKAKTLHAGKLVESNNTADQHEEIKSLLHEYSGSTICLYGLDALQFGAGQTVIRQLTEAITDEENSISLGLLGTKDEIARFFESAANIKDLFLQENCFTMQSPTLQEFMYVLQKKLKAMSLYLAPETQSEMMEKPVELWNESIADDWDEKTVQQFIDRSILPGVQHRLLDLLHKGQAENKVQLTTVFPQDINYSTFVRQQDAFESNLQQLNCMVGLENLKQNLNKTFCNIRFNHLRKQFGLPADDESCHHMIFTGNPGTGKTTVAKLIGQIYHSMGLLSKGELVMTERSQIVGRYIGETEKNMSRLIERAQGNVLFIDEAYTLYDGSNDRKDFGCRAIECLLTVLSRKNPDMLVIMAGYGDEMEKMLEVNQGLKGRFPNKFHFNDYSAEELVQIALNWIERKKYLLSTCATHTLQKFVRETVEQHDRYFSNARWMEQFLSHGVLPAMAERILKEHQLKDKLFYQTILQEDVELAITKFRSQIVPLHTPQRRIGFTA